MVVAKTQPKTTPAFSPEVLSAQGDRRRHRRHPVEP
jgi:hypothetical protein